MFPVAVERLSQGYMAYCPSLHGCFGQGLSYEQALDNVRMKTKTHLAELEREGRAVVIPVQLSLTFVEIER